MESTRRYFQRQIQLSKDNRDEMIITPFIQQLQRKQIFLSHILVLVYKLQYVLKTQVVGHVSLHLLGNWFHSRRGRRIHLEYFDDIGGDMDITLGLHWHTWSIRNTGEVVKVFFVLVMADNLGLPRHTIHI